MKRRQFLKGSAIVGASLCAFPFLLGESGMYASPSVRKIHQILDASRTTVGTLPIIRAFAGDHADYVSPYILLDEFGPTKVTAGSAPLRVDAHPHAGVIPTTYFLKGSGHHKDSLNYDFQIGKGDFMMFSSGRGAIHMEETGKELYDKGGQYHGFQIWLNMPAKFKYSDPSTDVYAEDAMPTMVKPDFTAKVILGKLFRFKSKIKLISPAFYYHIKLNPNGRIDIPTDPNHNAFVYAIQGNLELADQKALRSHQIALYQRGESDINLYSKEGAELLVMGGQPLNEPIYSYGPFVMNSEEQIRQCIKDYQEGRMGDPNKVN